MESNGTPDRLLLEYGREREQAARLLAELVGRGLPVAAFSPQAMDLEEAYLRAGIRQVEYPPQGIPVESVPEAVGDGLNFCLRYVSD